LVRGRNSEPLAAEQNSMRKLRRLVPPALVLWAGAAACTTQAFECGPSEAVVRRVIDGDTVELATGERVRYLLVDTPESTGGAVECFGLEARDENRALVEGRRVSLRYDAVCRDRYDRLLAYVTVDGIDVNALLIEEGYACTLVIPPNGSERAAEFLALEQGARDRALGLWGDCPAIPCD
jgi:micrococcal nuclease